MTWTMTQPFHSHKRMVLYWIISVWHDRSGFVYIHALWTVLLSRKSTTTTTTFSFLLHPEQLICRLLPMSEPMSDYRSFRTAECGSASDREPNRPVCWTSGHFAICGSKCWNIVHIGLENVADLGHVPRSRPRRRKSRYSSPVPANYLGEICVTTGL